MAGRKPKNPQDRRSVVARIRLTPDEQRAIQKRAVEAGVTFATYVRDTALGRRPRAKPATTAALDDALYELGRIANNLAQLQVATGDDTYGPWVTYVGKDMIERLAERNDLAGVLRRNLDAINGVGHLINGIARRANMGREIDDGERDEALTLLKDMLEPLRKAIVRTAKGLPVEESPPETGPEGDDAL